MIAGKYEMMEIDTEVVFTDAGTVHGDEWESRTIFDGNVNPAYEEEEPVEFETVSHHSFAKEHLETDCSVFSSVS